MIKLKLTIADLDMLELSTATPPELSREITRLRDITEGRSETLLVTERQQEQIAKILNPHVYANTLDIRPVKK